MDKRLALLMCAVITTALSLPNSASPDTLFKEKLAIAIGKGKQDGNVIHWKDCDGKNSRDYDAPPHWVDSAKNCDLSASKFGLEPYTSPYALQESDKHYFRVSDANAIHKIFPAAQRGERVYFYKTSSSVILRYDNDTVTLTTKWTDPQGSPK